MNKDDVTQALDLCISLCHNVTCSKYNIRRDTAVEELQVWYFSMFFIGVINASL